MDSSSSSKRRLDFVRIVVGMLIIRLIARNQDVDDAIGDEGLHVADILPESESTTYTGECISRNVVGEFTGELTEEQSTCITHMTTEECVEPCLWYTPDRVLHATLLHGSGSKNEQTARIQMLTATAHISRISSSLSHVPSIRHGLAFCQTSSSRSCHS